MNAIVFFSYVFGDPNSVKLAETAKNVALRLPRVRLVDGKTIPLHEHFSGEISSFIREKAAAVVAVLIEGRHGNGNVLYEIGVAVGADKKDKVVLVGELSAVPSMLRSYDVVDLDRGQLDWEVRFRRRLERKLRDVLNLGTDHFVEEKINRRYLDEELGFLKGSRSFRGVIATIKAGDLAKASAMVENILEADASNPDAYFFLADIHYLRGLAVGNPADRATWFYRQLEATKAGLELEPLNVLLLNSLARALIRLGDLKEARVRLQETLALQPGFSVAMYNLACVSALLGEADDAIAWLERAVTRDRLWRDFAKTDPDFEGLHGETKWDRLIFVETYSEPSEGG